LVSSESTIVNTAMIAKIPMVIPNSESIALRRLTVTDWMAMIKLSQTNRMITINKLLRFDFFMSMETLSFAKKVKSRKNYPINQ
jgi:hypothetical protein